MTVLNRLQQAATQLQPGPLYQSFGTLVRVNGMLLTVAGGQYTLGQRYQVEGQAGHWIEAEVVGFDREQAFLMPLTNASALTTGARVRPQVNALPVTTWMKGPAGAVDWPSTLRPQQLIAPVLRRPQVCELPAAMPNTPHSVGSSGEGFGIVASIARIATPEISHDAMQLTTFTHTPA